MSEPVTARAEVEATLRKTTAPMTSAEIFEQCKLVPDRATLSIVLSQLASDGRVKRAGHRQQEKGAPVMLYAIGTASTAKQGRPPKAAAAPAKKAPKNAATKAATKKQKPLRPAAARTPTAQPATDGKFRCGLWSDGTVTIDAEEGQFTLQPGELAALQRFLDSLVM